MAGVAAVAAAVALTFIPADEVPDSRVAGVDEAMAKVNDPKSVAPHVLSNTEQERVAASTAPSILLDARTGAVLGVDAGNVVPDRSASAAAPAP
ncbi:hypothetical protein GS489_00645 [Rhodococcus hoagii]|nr:hypothetical protein [Prescottella equi]